MGKKTCVRCKNLKSLDDFHIKKSSKDGKHCFCKECAINGAKKHYKENKNKIISNMNLYSKTKRDQIRSTVDLIKQNLKCIICKESAYCCLDFHHLNSEEKENNISYLSATKNIKKTVQEINKCICVCSNCHRKIHAGWVSVENFTPIQITYEDFLSQMEIIKENIPTIGVRKRFKKEKTRKPRPRKFNPSKEKLTNLISNHSFVYVGKLFGVSDNAIRKRCKLLGII